MILFLFNMIIHLTNLFDTNEAIHPLRWQTNVNTDNPVEK